MLRPGAIMGPRYSGTSGQGRRVSESDSGERVVPLGGKRMSVDGPPPYPPRFSAKERAFCFDATRCLRRSISYGCRLAHADPDAVTNLEGAFACEPCASACTRLRDVPYSTGDQRWSSGQGRSGF